MPVPRRKQKARKLHGLLGRQRFVLKLMNARSTKNPTLADPGRQRFLDNLRDCETCLELVKD